MQKTQSDVSIDAIACGFQFGFGEMAGISFCLESSAVCVFQSGIAEMAGISFYLESAISSGFRYSIAEMASISSRGGHVRAFTYDYVKTRPKHPAPHDLSARLISQAQTSSFNFTNFTNLMTIASVLSKTSPAFGSSSFITDATGYAVQHLQYLPFGETFVDQQNGYDARYTFSAKELDDETQYSYFGARYYDSDLSVWLSVDPMSDKYPSTSGYMYCVGNPVMYKDLFGLDTIPFNNKGEFGKPIPGGDDKTDTYVKVNNKEFENNKIKYNKNGKLRGRHKNMQIDKSFRESKETVGTGDVYKMDGFEKSKEIFEFFSDNTKVEWAQLTYKNTTTGDVKCDIMTNHIEMEVYPSTPYNNKRGDYTLVDIRHSHPSGFISPYDRQLHFRVNLSSPVNSYMYKYGKYYQYGSDRSSDENYAVQPISY
ncbi:MAG: RHS repeat-associated core domain-containing protein [Bacteroidales bacterium]